MNPSPARSTHGRGHAAVLQPPAASSREWPPHHDRETPTSHPAAQGRRPACLRCQEHPKAGPRRPGIVQNARWTPLLYQTARLIAKILASCARELDQSHWFLTEGDYAKAAAWRPREGRGGGVLPTCPASSSTCPGALRHAGESARLLASLGQFPRHRGPEDSVHRYLMGLRARPSSFISSTGEGSGHEKPLRASSARGAGWCARTQTLPSPATTRTGRVQPRARRIGFANPIFWNIDIPSYTAELPTSPCSCKNFVDAILDGLAAGPRHTAWASV